MVVVHLGNYWDFNQIVKFICSIYHFNQLYVTLKGTLYPPSRIIPYFISSEQIKKCCVKYWGQHWPSIRGQLPGLHY